MIGPGVCYISLTSYLSTRVTNPTPPPPPSSTKRDLKLTNCHQICKILKLDLMIFSIYKSSLNIIRNENPKCHFRKKPQIPNPIMENPNSAIVGLPTGSHSQPHSLNLFALLHQNGFFPEFFDSFYQTRMRSGMLVNGVTASVQCREPFLARRVQAGLQ